MTMSEPFVTDVPPPEVVVEVDGAADPPLEEEDPVEVLCTFFEAEAFLM